MEKTPVRLSLLRRIAWLGGDRRLIGMAAICSMALALTMFVGFGLSYGAFVLIPGFFFLGVLWTARAMYKADPWMIDVLIRHYKYSKHYAPKAHAGKMPPSVNDYAK